MSADLKAQALRTCADYLDGKGRVEYAHDCRVAADALAAADGLRDEFASRCAVAEQEMLALRARLAVPPAVGERHHDVLCPMSQIYTGNLGSDLAVPCTCEPAASAPSDAPSDEAVARELARLWFEPAQFIEPTTAEVRYATDMLRAVRASEQRAKEE